MEDLQTEFINAVMRLKSALSDSYMSSKFYWRRKSQTFSIIVIKDLQNDDNFCLFVTNTTKKHDITEKNNSYIYVIQFNSDKTEAFNKLKNAPYTHERLEKFSDDDIRSLIDFINDEYLRIALA